MNIFQKARVRTAVDSRTNMNFNSSHITTADFFQLTVPYIRHLIPGQKISVDFRCFSRLAPMPVPTLGNLDIKHHAFFVPFKCVMPSWDDFITDAVHTSANNIGTSGIVPFAHRINVADLTTALSSPIFSTAVNVQSSEDLDKVDFTFVSGSSQETMNYQQFTQKGRAVYKILRQLGYDIATDTSAQAYTSDMAVYVSALPLLCLTRLYIDWYYPSAYVGDDNYNSLMAIMKHDPVNGYTLTATDLGFIFLYLSSVCYDSDYFTSAFDNPAGPNQGFFTSFKVPDISTYPSGVSDRKFDGSVFTSVEGTPMVSSGSAGIVNTSSGGITGFGFSQYLLNSLHALSDYMKRHQLVGSRALDRYLARFGVKLDQNDRSILLGSATQGVQLGAIMSNADTEGARLGDYAGQGYSNDGASFSFTSEKDYGIFFIVSTVMPRIGYVQGIDRNIFHLTKLDFFTPEFDALGSQAISASELKTSGLIVTDDSNDIKIGGTSPSASIHEMFGRVFGFTPRYAEYKIQLDKLTGDFNLPRLSTAGFTSDSWHLYRLFDSEVPTDYVHSKAFTQGTDAISPASQYDRIFGVVNGSADHFVLVYNFQISSSMPAKALFDTYDFDEEKGRIIETEVGGVKVN